MAHCNWHDSNMLKMMFVVTKLTLFIEERGKCKIKLLKIMDFLKKY